MSIGAEMNCFDWQNRSSDYLDGGLTPVQKKSADDHLDQCKSCGERYKHYRLILTSIASQPRSTLPVPIRRSPLAVNVPKIDVPNARSRWERTPWFVRTSVEGLGVAFTILFVVAMVPRIRTIYEKSIDRRLDTLNLDEIAFEGEGQVANAQAPLARGRTSAVNADGTADEFNGEAEGSPEALIAEEEEASAIHVSTDQLSKVRVGNSEIWRFNLKTSSPHEIRPKIVQTLTELSVPANTPGIGGIEAPGGIQFDLMVPKQIIPDLKNQLHKLAGNALPFGKLTEGSANEPALNEAFTWYKNKSKRAIPAGKARVVIWLSQM